MFPKPPSASLNWDKIGLEGFDKASHVEVSYSTDTKEWSSPRAVKEPWLRVHGLSPGLNYGQQCYEGLKAFRSPDNRVLVFRPYEHAKRMTHSAQIVSIPAVPESLFVDCVNRVVAANTEFVPPYESNGFLYIRPVLFGSSAQLALSPPKEFTFCVYVQPGSAYHGALAQEAVVLEDFDRAAPRGVGNAKVGGNYAPVMRWTDGARRNGFGLTLHLDSATHTEIDEFSTSSFIGVRNHGGHIVLVTPNSPSVLSSVTNRTCIEIAMSLGWDMESRAIKWDELQFFSEVLAVGTAAHLLPVSSITRPSTNEKIAFGEGSKEAGPCCQILRNVTEDLMRGRQHDTRGWCYNVTQPVSEKGTSIPQSRMMKLDEGFEYIMS